MQPANGGDAIDHVALRLSHGHVHLLCHLPAIYSCLWLGWLVCGLALQVCDLVMIRHRRSVQDLMGMNICRWLEDLAKDLLLQAGVAKHILTSKIGRR